MNIENEIARTVSEAPEVLKKAPAHFKPQVLLVEDDDSYILALIEMLRDCDYSVHVEKSGDKALLCHEENYQQYAAIILDYKIEGSIHGEKLIRAFLEQCPEQKIIVNTGYGSMDLAVEVVNAGSCKILEKSAGFGALLESLYECVDSFVEKRKIAGLEFDQNILFERPISRTKLAEAKAALAEFGIYGTSSWSLGLIKRLEKIVHSGADVLLIGESRVGK